ncbi:hypothetical protein [Pedobacter frigiditerrae]|uniref:hypothetical protein n=1 Tax=Pedobacter frigiditerrae TaxID=2530452 RepID=UPI002931658B|nr:hypothetical protein [Pedobacter frigiditerrae]
MKKYIFLLLTFISALSHAQNLSNDEEIVDSKTKSFIVQLKKAGIDTILTYQLKQTFSSIKVIPENISQKEKDSILCESENPAYVLWKSQGNLYIVKINPCFSFTELAVNSNKLFLLLNNYPGILKSSPVKVFQFKDKSGRILAMSVNHSTITELTVKFGDTKKHILINHYDLLKKSDTYLNLNYKANQNNIGFRIADEISFLIKTLSFKKQLF